MKSSIAVVCIVALMAATVGCNREADTRVDVEAIQDIEKQWNQDFASRDVDKLASYYKDDAVLMPPGSPRQ